MNLFFWKHKHSDAVIKHEDFEKLPDEHKKKFEKVHNSNFKNGKSDSTHHVMNNNGDYSLYATMSIGSIGLGFATGAAIGAVALAQSELVPEGPLPSPEFGGGSGGGAGAGGSFDSGDVQAPVVDSVSGPANNCSQDSSSSSDNNYSSNDNVSSSSDSTSNFDSGSSSFDGGGGF